ncbi:MULTISPECIES: hypothetical protein [Peribacillus]|uniref:hypothetical protein n=1 Tax=Peribacillus TaxID=2675229 RepID=UPI002079D766|nr:hypothetical protein [Peribacillus asahii]USK69387.1 hypothetical protein LIS76_17770 [Peribacillus asahii]
MKEKNEAGYTLVLVLLTITLIFIFSLTLISSVLNSASQNKKTEENIQLNRLSEMGVTYTETAVKEANKQANASIVAWLNSDPAPSNPNIPYEYQLRFETALDTLIKYETNSILEKELEEDSERFKIVINAISLENTNTIKVVYTVTPSLTKEYSKTLSSQHTITINLNIN